MTVRRFPAGAMSRTHGALVLRRRARSRPWLLLALLVACAVGASAARGAPFAETCDAAAAHAARQTGVPLAVLRAIALTETGRARDGRFAAWPWTVNVAGRGQWFDSRAAALAHARAALGRGETSFDLGCFQINYRWHGTAFASLDAMIDPEANALYAAQFLRALHAETGDWHAAAGAYHSRTPRYASRYRSRFARILADLEDPVALPPPPRQPRAPRPNGFPLLIADQGGLAASAGSLMPAAAGTGRPPLLGDG